ncbi:MAG: amidohydrolase family protein, partial [Acidimicrobiia bacterium]|nr:amidohydrolase family protein [Acidimicrobiia bacterium]
MTDHLIVADQVRTAAGLQGGAVLIRAGRVTAIGRADDLRGPGVREDHFPGGVIIPGLRDAHLHPLPYVQSLSRTTLKDAGDLDQLLTRIRIAATGLPAGEPLIAIRMDDEALVERRLPTRHDLDLAAGDRPVLVYRYCGHIAVAN